MIGYGNKDEIFYLSFHIEIDKKGRAISDPALSTLPLCQLNIHRIMEVCNDPSPCCSPEGSPQQRAAH